jgi:thiol-disulfide isomerase/thioredoxin
LGFEEYITYLYKRGIAVLLKRIWSVGLLIITSLTFSSVALAQLSGYQSMQPKEQIDFTFTDAEGKSHKISDYRGKIVVLNFWATWCAPCVAEMPSLNNLAETFPSDEVAVLTLCKEKKLLEDAKQLFTNRNLKSLPLYFDENAEGVTALGVKGLPTTFILNREGYLIGKLQGGTEWDHYEVLDLIQSYIEGKTPVITSGFDRIINWFQHLFKK